MIRARRVYRWIVFLLAGLFVLRMTVFGDYSAPLGPFRFLTVWALLASFFCASRMIARDEGRSARLWDGTVAATAVLNTMVVLLYWRLYLADPASVTRDGALGDWDMELYLHGLGPALQVFDALVLHRALARPRSGRRALGLLVAVVAAYTIWAERVVAPLNDLPAGRVTQGLPYRFLNDLALPERLQFYGTNLIVAALLLALYAALTRAPGRLSRRRAPRSAAP